MADHHIRLLRAKDVSNTLYLAARKWDRSSTDVPHHRCQSAHHCCYCDPSRSFGFRKKTKVVTCGFRIYLHNAREVLVQRPATVDAHKVYDPPVARKLTREQAILVLVGHAYIGHSGARELLDLLFP